MCHYSSVKRCADFILKMHQKNLADALRPDPKGQLTALSQTPKLDLRDRVETRE